jgi:hypothetical protein
MFVMDKQLCRVMPHFDPSRNSVVETISQGLLCTLIHPICFQLFVGEKMLHLHFGLLHMPPNH